MKKNYFKPESEYTELYAAFALCGLSNDTSGGSDNGDKFSPKRRTPKF